MQRIIEVRIANDGQISIQTRGYVGADCLNASRFLEEALGLRQIEQKTTEYFQSAAQAQQIEQ